MVTAHAVPPAPQFKPAPCTRPPVGAVMVSVYGGPVGDPPLLPPLDVNVALQVRAASTSTEVVVLVPAHEPPQPVNVYPLAGVAVSVAVVALPNVTWHVAPLAPHVSPFPVTVPPVGVGPIVSEYVVPPPLDVNVAAHVRGPFRSTQTAALVPEQFPDHPVNV